MLGSLSGSRSRTMRSDTSAPPELGGSAPVPVASLRVCARSRSWLFRSRGGSINGLKTCAFCDDHDHVRLKKHDDDE